MRTWRRYWKLLREHGWDDGLVISWLVIPNVLILICLAVSVATGHWPDRLLTIGAECWGAFIALCLLVILIHDFWPWRFLLGLGGLAAFIGAPFVGVLAAERARAAWELTYWWGVAIALTLWFGIWLSLAGVMEWFTDRGEERERTILRARQRQTENWEERVAAARKRQAARTGPITREEYEAAVARQRARRNLPPAGHKD